MAVTQNTYTGDGSTVLFSFTFPYLATTDIKVSVDGTETTAYSLANATTIQFSAAPANGSAVRIFRDTNVDTLSAEFFSGSAIRANDLNSDFNQVLYSTQETVNRRVESTGGDMTGDLTMVNADIVFEGSTNDSNETTLTVVDPTADRTITLPNVSGTVVTTGDSGTVSTGMVADSAITSAKIANGTIVDADVANNAELSVSKLQDGSPRQLLQTNTAGTGVEWTSNVDVPGSLDVTGAATLDNGLSVTGNIGVSGTVDGRDVAADGTKLDGIESGATADQTAAEIRTLVESASDSNVFTDADHSKLNAIEAGATADQTASEIRTLVGNATNSNVYIDSHHAILDGATVNTSELNTLDGITASTAELNQLDGKSISSTLTPSNANDIPTSSAVNTFVSGLLNALGGFVAITNENSFPTSNPDPSDDAGTIVSIADAGGMVINSSGVGTGQTTAGTTVTINGFPGSLQSTTLGVGLGLQVQTTSTLNTYTYHKLIAKEADVKQLSDDINDFQARYRVSDTAPTTDLDEGDLWYDKTANKMKVYDTSTSAWKEVQSVGNFFINTISSSSATGGGSATFNGSAYRFTLSNAPQNAQQLLVSVNGVIQKPNAGTSQPSEGFALDTNDIIFAAAPATGSNFFIITVGSTVNIGTPSNNTVNAAHIIDGSITNAEVSGSAAIAGTKISPNFGSQNVVTTGSAGIGTTSPSSSLHLVGTDTAYTGNVAVGAIATIADTAGRTVQIVAPGTVGEGGIGTSSNHDFTLFTGNSEKVRLKQNGNLGLGINNPADQLHIHTASSGAANVRFSSTDVPNGFFVGFDGQEIGQIWHTANKDIRIATNNTERLRIDSSGNVGIGTSAPGYPLTVKGLASFEATNSTNDWVIYTYTDNTFRLNYNGAGADEITIDSDGNVGIGETSPDTRLHTKQSTTGGTGLFIQNSNGATNSSADLYFGNWNGSSTTTPQARIQAINTNSNTAATDLAFWTYSGSSTSEKMRLSSSGELGLGVSSPSQRLHVDCGAPSSSDKIIGLFQSESARQMYLGWDDSQSTMVLGTLTDHALTIHTSGQNNERLRVDANGLKFNGDTATANALSDYEEGTWTPVIKSGSNTIGYSGGNQHFKYTKIGDKVTVYFSMNGVTTSGTTGGNCEIEGLPFAMATNATVERTMGTIFMFYSSGFRLSSFPAWPHMNSPNSKVEFYNKGSAAASYSGTPVGQVGANTYCFFQITYRVA